MSTKAEENYLKAIFKLSEKEQNSISTNAIAEELETKASSVSDMLKKLSEKKLIHYIKYQGVSLTKLGHRLAVHIVRKHRLWEVFLVNHLHFKWDEVHDMAEQLEHIKSTELVNRLDIFLNLRIKLLDRLNKFSIKWITLISKSAIEKLEKAGGTIQLKK